LSRLFSMYLTRMIRSRAMCGGVAFLRRFWFYGYARSSKNPRQIIMQNEMIKGMREHFGFTYQGILPTPFAGIACPRCGKETNNFDDVDAVDARIKKEGFSVEYTMSVLKPLSSHGS
jgi:hypothetical protein